MAENGKGCLLGCWIHLKCRVYLLAGVTWVGSLIIMVETAMKSSVFDSISAQAKRQCGRAVVAMSLRRHLLCCSGHSCQVAKVACGARPVPVRLRVPAFAFGKLRRDAPDRLHGPAWFVFQSCAREPLYAVSRLSGLLTSCMAASSTAVRTFGCGTKQRSR